MLFADLVATSTVVGATRSRKEKAEALAVLLPFLIVAAVVGLAVWLIRRRPSVAEDRADPAGTDEIDATDHEPVASGTIDR